jgi:hypothetical protein
MGQLINYTLFFRENNPSKDYVITLLTAGDFKEFTKFVNGFNAYFKEEDNHIPKERVFRDCLEKVYILKNLIKKGKSGRDGSGVRVLSSKCPSTWTRKISMTVFKASRISS